MKARHLAFACECVKTRRYLTPYLFLGYEAVLRDVGAVAVAVADIAQPAQRFLFELIFVYLGASGSGGSGCSTAFNARFT